VSAVFHLVLILLAALLFIGWWFMVQSAPGLLSRFLPPGLTLAVGTFFLVIAAFSAFAAAFFMRDAEAVLGSLVPGFVGLWFMLATLSGSRGSYGYEVLMKHLMPMVAMLLVLLIAAFYIESLPVLMLLQAVMILGGFVLTMRYFRAWP
jgi:hypothetical protein